MQHLPVSLPLVLIPGFMLDSALWDNIAAPLEAMMPIVPLEPTRGDTLTAMAEDLLQQCPEQCIVLGFSMGGYLAREMTALAPQKIKGLILVASSLREETPEQSAGKRMAIEAMRKGNSFKGMSTVALKAALHPEHATPAVIEHLRAMGIRLGTEIFIRQSVLDRPLRPENSSLITCPALIIAAKNDRLRSLEESQELAHTLPHTTLKVIPQCGHMVPLEQPDALLAEIKEWLHLLPHTQTATKSKNP